MFTVTFAVLCSFILCISSAHGDVVTQDIEYLDGETVLRGYLAYDEALTEEVPGVLICHQWMGVTDHEKSVARRLAAEGFVAFVLDIYGVDNRPADRSEAPDVASVFYNDRDLLRRRVQLGLKQLREHSWSDDDRLAAIGYCFGGTTVLELARSGANINGVVSLHGGLTTDDPNDARNITAKVLVLHGADDPFAATEEVVAFMEEMRAAKVDMQLILYGGAVHAFTQPSAGDDPSRGAAYNADAARRSWKHMMMFFDELFEIPKRHTSKGEAKVGTMATSLSSQRDSESQEKQD